MQKACHTFDSTAAFSMRSKMEWMLKNQNHTQSEIESLRARIQKLCDNNLMWWLCWIFQVYINITCVVNDL